MLRQTEFDFLRTMVRARSAIALEPGQEALVESRLAPVIRELELPSATDLVAVLRAAQHSEIERRVVEAMTTNETSFFRDRHPFEALRTRVIPELIAARAARGALRFWSNACSSGQEAYSLAMLLAEHFPTVRDWDVSILATDLSRDMVHRTARGIYGQLEVNRGLPASLLVKHFERSGTQWRVRPELRFLVHARELNLADSWPPLGRFDVILLRNVLIYFDVETRRRILRRARQVLQPDGYLLLGSAETTAMIDPGWDRISYGGSSVYRPLVGSPRMSRVAAP